MKKQDKKLKREEVINLLLERYNITSEEAQFVLDLNSGGAAVIYYENKKYIPKLLHGLIHHHVLHNYTDYDNQLKKLLRITNRAVERTMYGRLHREYFDLANEIVESLTKEATKK